MINYIVGGFEQISTAGANIYTLTTTLVSPVNGRFSGQKCEKIIFTVETGNINVTWDGTTPDQATYLGTVYVANKPNLFVMEGHANINRLQFCGVYGGTALLNIHYLFLA